MNGHSAFLDSGAARLHVYSPDGPAAGRPVVLIHGSLESGRIFYSKSGRGLAPFLAAAGFRVYVPDWRGKGLSTPSVSNGADVTQHSLIVEDLPALFAWVAAHHPDEKISLVTHSWGGTLVNAFMARFPEAASKMDAVVHIGAKRRVRVQHPARWFKLNLIWNTLAPFLAARHGYFPARKWGAGAEDESPSLLRDTAAWIDRDPWVDTADGFDYGAAIRRLPPPRLWYMTGSLDFSLAHPADVRAFMRECGHELARYTTIGRRSGFGFSAGHVTILTHPKAAEQLYPQIAAFLAG